MEVELTALERFNEIERLGLEPRVQALIALDSVAAQRTGVRSIVGPRLVRLGCWLERAGMAFYPLPAGEE